jgi:hypothetical protein
VQQRGGRAARGRPVALAVDAEGFSHLLSPGLNVLRAVGHLARRSRLFPVCGSDPGTLVFAILLHEAKARSTGAQRG